MLCSASCHSTASEPRACWDIQVLDQPLQISFFITANPQGQILLSIFFTKEENMTVIQRVYLYHAGKQKQDFGFIPFIGLPYSKVFTLYLLIHIYTHAYIDTHSHALTHTHTCRHLYTLTCTHMCTHTKSLNEEACGNIDLLKWLLVLLANGHCQRTALHERTVMKCITVLVFEFA